jgi:hypothetical protein
LDHQLPTPSASVDPSDFLHQLSEKKEAQNVGQGYPRYGWTHTILYRNINQHLATLVGGFNPSEKYDSQLG